MGEKQRKNKKIETELCCSELLLGRALDVVGGILGKATWDGDGTLPQAQPASQMDILSKERSCSTALKEWGLG